MILILLFIALVGYDYYKFTKSEYMRETELKYHQVRFDKGYYGEYLTFEKLRKINGKSKIIANAYIPKSDGDKTELDLIFIHRTGIYVLESKNYSGWIFGNEKDFKWTQSLKGGKKHKFYNPIKQNMNHIKHLSDYLKVYDSDVFYSAIVFSSRCELKKITFTSDLIVTKRPYLNMKLNKVIKKRDFVLTDLEIDNIYSLLKVHSNQSNEEKAEHVKNVVKYS